MATDGVGVVEQLQGRMKFYHVGDPVRRDMRRACDTINELLNVQLEGGLRGTTHTAASVAEWLGDRGIKLLPWQRKKLGLDPTTE